MELDGGLSSKPLKPPRGNKGTPGGGGAIKETGILMRVIKTLSVAASTEHRDRERTKLEKDFRKSDAQLDALLAKHQPSLSQVMQLFSQVCGEVGNAKERVKSVKGNLQQCKMLLQCRREELQRLWLEGIEHKHALHIFDQIGKLREGSENFTKLLNRKQYMPAVEALMGCLQMWNPSLDQIEGLQDLHLELKAKKDKVYDTLKEELYREMYHSFSKEPFEKRQGSGVQFSRGGSDRLSSGKMGQIKAKRIFLDFQTNTGNFVKTVESQELDLFITTVVDCMVRLDEVSRFLKDLRHNLEGKLMEMVNTASQHIIEYGDITGANETDASLFQQLIQFIFTQFRSIIRSHVLIIREIEKSLGNQKQNYKIQNEEYLWGKVQTVLQSTLKIYFDLSESKSDHGSTISGSSDFLDSGLSINSYFVKRRAARMKRPLFKFKYSLHGLNVNDYVVQGNDTNRSAVDRHRFLVCKPSPRNIINIYGVVQELCTEIEQTTQNGQKCELRKFMANNVNKVFIQQIYKEISESVDSAKKNLDLWKDCTSLEESKSFGCSRPLLQSVVQTGRNIQEVIRLAKELPTHSDQLARILQSIFSSYLEACQNAYQAIVQPDIEDKAVISSSWVKDADIQRLLKSLPNWLKLLKATKEAKHPNQSMDDSPEDVRAQNIRESDLLTGLFYGKVVQRHEIITETKQMNRLAHLQESLDWFANQVSTVANTFESLAKNSDNDMKEHVENLQEITTLFNDLGDVCLLVLHLEVRVHCFHFLIPMAQNADFSPGVDSQNPDPEVIKLVRDLSHINNILSGSLQHVKCKYIFEGVGQLVSTILVGCAEHIQRINDNGVKKMCRNIFALQKTLSDVTNLPEQAMDHARQFYELFTLSPEDVVNGILEKGPQFKELEYMNALKLLYRSKPGHRTHTLEDHLNRLSNILGDVGVVV